MLFCPRSDWSNRSEENGRGAFGRVHSSHRVGHRLKWRGLTYNVWRSQNRYKRLLASLCLSVRPHGTTRLPLDGLKWNFIFELISKICYEKPCFIKIWLDWRVLYVKMFSHLRQYPAACSLEWEMFQIKVVENTKSHIFMFISYFSENCAGYKIMSRNMEEPERPERTIQYGACALHAE